MPDFLLIILIVFLFVIVLSIILPINGQPPKIELLNEESSSESEIVFSFWLFSQKNIDDLFKLLAPTQEIIIKDTITFFGEGSIDLKILPTSIKSSYQQTIEKQTILPTPVFKYEFCLRKLRSESKLTIIDSGSYDNHELERFNKLLSDLEEFEKFRVDPSIIEKQREDLKLRKSIESIVVERARKIGTINCFFRNYRFTIKKSQEGRFYLISSEEDNGSIEIKVIINNKTLTEGGLEHFNTHVDKTQGFTVFGKGTYYEDNLKQKGVSITPFVIF